jgi:hypothetical protein
MAAAEAPNKREARCLVCIEAGKLKMINQTTKKCCSGRLCAGQLRPSVCGACGSLQLWVYEGRSSNVCRAAHDP